MLRVQKCDFYQGEKILMVMQMNMCEHAPCKMYSTFQSLSIKGILLLMADQSTT